jgi:hypothetical protein
MKYDAIKKRGEQWVKIRPALQVYNDSGVLTETVEDAWFLTAITDDSLTLRSRDTAHTKVIGLDHIHNYMEDPEGERTGGTTGTLVMNVQLLLHEGVLLVEPVAPPGNALKAFVRARPRATLMAAASRMRAQAELEQARKAYAWSMEGVQSADAAFAEIPRAIESLSDELRAAGQPIDLVVKPSHGRAFLLGAAGWWVSFNWERMAANCIEDSRLTVIQWDGHPQWPGYMVPEPGRMVGRDRYTFGLAALNQPRWLAEASAVQSYTTTDLVQEVLTRLFKNPHERRR